jgi:dienelactone hydrolase
MRTRLPRLPVLLLLAALALIGAGCGDEDEGAESGTASGTGSAPGTSTTASATPLPDLFAYDADAPLGETIGKVLNPGYPVKVRDASYASPGGDRVTAFLVTPPRRGKLPAVIYLHGSGGSRYDLLPEATWLAARGAVTLTIDSAHARGPEVPETGEEGVRADGELLAQTVQDLRRAIDLLREQPQVDPERIGFVGFSAGARAGALFAGADDRLDAVVLWSGGALAPSRYLEGAPAAVRERLQPLMDGLDPVPSLQRASEIAFLVQTGTKDEVTPQEALARVTDAVREPRDVRRYAAGHALSKRATRDRLDWLARTLGVTGPATAGAATGPD